MRTVKTVMLASAAGILAFAGAQNAHADEHDVSGFIALGGIYTPDFEGSEDYEVSPFGVGRLEYQHYYVETRGPGLRANVSPFEHFEFGPAIGYRGERDDDVENDAVSRLRDIDGAVEAGGFVKVKTNGVMHPSDELGFEVDVRTDVSDTHEGTLVSFGPSYGYSPSREWRLGAGIAATYVTDDYAETYFSVDANNAARSGLRRYNAEGGIKDVGVTFTANYAINERWGIPVLAGYSKLLGDAADSPIVDQGSDNQFILGTGLSYRF